MKKLVLGAIAVALVAVGAGTYAWAASTDAQTLNACVDNDNGNVRLVAVAGACKKGEHAVSWNTAGPQGLAGSTGPTGPAGAQGPAGKDGASGGAAANPDAAAGSVQITGQHQGAIGPINLQAVSHEIVSPRDAASGLATGKRQHKPITITKQLDQSTPLLLNALVTNENLSSVTITVNSGGNPVATIKLTNASIADYVDHGTTETWSFTYQKITWTWLDGGITAQDDWETPTA
jgi:type VI secretion system secreted protein Hcp